MKKDLENKDRKKIILLVIIISALLVVLIVVAVLINSINKKQEDLLNQKEYTSISDFKTIEDVAHYLECDYKKKENSTEENYRYDVFMQLKVAPYEDGESNEVYYEKLVSLLAKVLEYSNYRVIDKDKNLVIDVVCDSKEEKVKTIYINGESSYFSVNDSINKINNKTEDSITDITIQSSIIKQLESNNWNSSKIDFGKVDSKFNGYNIYFDEGYETKLSNNNVINVVFTEKYKDEVISNLKTTSGREEIIEKLGNPTFEDKMFGFIGYKSDKIYAFFNTEEKEISIYKIDKTEVKLSDLEGIFKKYKSNNDTVNFIHSVRANWTDYDAISTDKDNLYVRYINKGIKLEYNKNGNIFNVYKNSNIKLTADDLKEYKFINIVDKDLYYLVEIERKSIKRQALYTANDEINEENRKLKTNDFCLARKKMNDNSYDIKIISRNSKYMNSELRENVTSIMWISDTVLVYSVSGKGIYAYSASMRKYTTIKIANATFDLKEYKDGVLYYDDTSIKLK